MTDIYLSWLCPACSTYNAAFEQTCTQCESPAPEAHHEYVELGVAG